MPDFACELMLPMCMVLFYCLEIVFGNIGDDGKYRSLSKRLAIDGKIHIFIRP